MSSSFDTKSDIELEDSFLNAAALYCTLKQSGPHCIRRAELKQGSVAAEAIDFIADFEVRCKQLAPPPYDILSYMGEDLYQRLPKHIQRELGRLFLATNLDCSGHYRVLYYKAKNNQLQDRVEPTHFPEEV
jgi:hypothetical protein